MAQRRTVISPGMHSPRGRAGRGKGVLGRGTWILCPSPQFPLLLPNSRRTKGHRPGGGRLAFRSLHPSLAGPPLWSVSGEVWCLHPHPHPQNKRRERLGRVACEGGGRLHPGRLRCGYPTPVVSRPPGLDGF